MNAFHASRLTGALVSAAALVVIVFGLQAAQVVVIPVLLAVYFAIMAWPVLVWLRARGMPSSLALMVAVIGMVGAVTLVALLVGASVTDLAARLPTYQDRVRNQLDEMLRMLEAGGMSLPDSTFVDYVDPGAALGLVSGILSGLSGALGQALLTFAIMLFLLLEGTSFPGKLRMAFGPSSTVTAQMDRFVASVNHYMALKTAISIVTGVLVAVWVGVLGVPYALLWGFVAFLLNFVPNIGSILAAVPAILLALIELGPGRALLVAVGYVVLNLVIGNGLEPRVMGKGLGLSTAVVLLSLVFWAWVLGSVGMVLSVPLTMTIKLALETSSETRWIAVLLGRGDSPSSANPAPR